MTCVLGSFFSIHFYVVLGTELPLPGSRASVLTPKASLQPSVGILIHLLDVGSGDSVSILVSPAPNTVCWGFDEWMSGQTDGHTLG